MVQLFIILISALIISNLIYLRKYKKYKAFKDNKFFLPQISLSQVDPIFTTNEFGPLLQTEVSFMGRGDLNVPGGTSDTEAWIISVLSKKAKNIFELGTCTGKTSYLMAKNSPADSAVYTLTLPPEEIANYELENKDDAIATVNAKNESSFVKFFYTGTDVEKKIHQIFCDSKKFDENKYNQFFDLIFIDGSHAYSYIKSDTEKCLKMLKPGGIILWHDYHGQLKGSKDVCKYLNELSSTKKIFHIKETTLAFYRSEK